MVITKVTVNTGSIHFNNLEELSAFVSDFNVIKNIRLATTQQKTEGLITETSTVLTSSNTFEETIQSAENLSFGYAPEWAALIQALGWTSETNVSYEYA